MNGIFSEFKGADLFRALILVACGFWLTACATPQPRYATLEEAPRARPRQDGPRVASSANPVRGTMKPYKVGGRWYTPKEQPNYEEVGLASWYGGAHHGKPTATGETFDQWRISAAHKTLPLPCVVAVTNLDTGKTIRVRVNDRGPFVDGRIIDLSRAAAEELGFDRKGVTRVRVRYLGPAERG